MFEKETSCGVGRKARPKCRTGEDTHPTRIWEVVYLEVPYATTKLLSTCEDSMLPTLDSIAVPLKKSRLASV